MNGEIGESRPMNMIVIQYAIKNEEEEKNVAASVDHKAY